LGIYAGQPVAEDASVTGVSIVAVHYGRRGPVAAI
jgi:hypothetical protein